MKIQYFGDSYDVVKKSIISWLADFGPWSVHPMFSEPVTDVDAQKFSQFIGARIVSTEALLPSTDRKKYFSVCRNTENLFLDPDIGIYLQDNCIPKKRSGYVFASELTSLIQNRPSTLTLIFDQSLSRGQERSEIETKLRHFAGNGIQGVAYLSHACFILLANETELIQRAYSTVIAKSSLPETRIVRI